MSSPNWLLTELQLPRAAGRNASSATRTTTRGASGYGGAGANPSALSSDGKGFSIAWQANPAVPGG